MSDDVNVDVLKIEQAKDRLAKLPAVDRGRLRQQRMDRLQAELKKRDIGGMLLYDPVNVRYATDCRNMQIWTMHNSARYCLVPAEGKAVIFDYVNCEHLSEGIDTIGETRPAVLWFYHSAGSNRQTLIGKWADDLAEVVSRNCPNRRIAIDRLDNDARAALEARQISVSFGQDVIEHARCIKTEEEMKAQKRSAFVYETGLARLKEITRPGISENELWATFGAINASLGGDYVETRLLVAGPRTNPWYMEASERPVQVGELVAFDTDMIGPFGYSTDISRTWLCDEVKPTEEQKTVYKLAHEQVHHNMALLKAGLGFRELAEKSWRIPDRYEEFEVGVIVHGIGMCNEYPQVAPLKWFEQTGYDGQFQPNMTVSVESYIGERGAKEGVKLEEMVRITETGSELVAHFPFEDNLLN
ncbi:MAG: M24 family metallopeptidase [Rhizobiaceae bacterium]